MVHLRYCSDTFASFQPFLLSDRASCSELTRFVDCCRASDHRLRHRERHKFSRVTATADGHDNELATVDQIGHRQSRRAGG